MRESAGLDVLDRAECLRLLAEAPIGRVVFTDQALPAVQPVVFAVHGDTVVFRACDSDGVAESVHGAVVAFEADRFDPVTNTGWSVTVVGRACTVVDPDELTELALMPLEPWTHDDVGGFVRIEIELVNGRSIPPR
ncbi:MAG: pyridoxamine 5'-phosphate oxidase family protein [Streptosporangiales bacterium]|nr:pyridoxamine 5'-phosphate oxidase family protein [Streptosporangiales bacterium]MBO0891728.1 pyridoxamine 5'-phosphate oxidase family protein [Acidothermales bacterium]